jgi:NitT/TauT family transport system substrate-binding protein
MNKKNVFIIVCIVLMISLSASGKKEKETTTKAIPAEKPAVVKVAALNGPSGIGMAYLFENHPDLAGIESTFETVASADVLLPKLLKGELDIGILPPNAAAKVYSKNGSIIMGAVVGEGMLSVISRDTDVQSFADLAGKTVFVAGQGATPEYMASYIAKKSGLEIGEAANQINLSFSIPAAEIAPSIIGKKIEYALVPEPFATVATMKDPSIKRVINVQDAFASVSGEKSYPMTVVVLRSEFAAKYPETVTQFLSAYKNAIAWTNENPAEAGKLVEKHSLGLTAAIATKAIPNAAFTFVSATEARPEVEKLLSLFLEFAPESIGGSLPDDGFYFK